MVNTLITIQLYKYLKVSFSTRTKLIIFTIKLISMSNQTLSSVLLKATTWWGSRLQQLEIHIREIVAPLVAVDGMRPCLHEQMASLITRLTH